MSVGTETTIDRKALHAKMREGGFRNLDEKTGKNPSKEKGKDNVKTSERTPEKRKVKNQAERERANEHNERVKRERREIGEAVDSALRMVSACLQDPKLSERDRARLQWIEKSALDAKGQMNFADYKDTYSVEVKDGKDKVVLTRSEGLPVDELWGVVRDLKAQAQKQIHVLEVSKSEKRESQKLNDEYETKKARTNINGDEWKHKLAWYDVLEKLPEANNMRAEAYALVEIWENSDRQSAVKGGGEFKPYDPDHRKQQLGEALRQVVERNLKLDESKLREALEKRQKNLGKYQKLMDVLRGKSLPYFKYHFPENYQVAKNPKNLNAEQQQKQHPYTEREADLIHKDLPYRKMLKEGFAAQGVLSKDFENMDSTRQDYELAMLALQHRRILTLPKERPVPREEFEEEIKPQVKVEPKKDEKIKEGPVIVLPPTGPGEFGVRTGGRDGPVTPGVIERKPKKLFLVDISEIAKRMAEEVAGERIKKEYSEMGRFKRAFKGMSENKRRIEYYKQAKDEIEKDNNLMKAISQRVSGQPMPGNSRVSADYLKILDGVMTEYKHDVVDSQREMGEVVQNDPAIQSAVAELLVKHANNSWGDLGSKYNGLKGREAVEFYVKDQILPLLQGKQWSNDPYRQSERKGILFASNFWNLAETYKGDITKKTHEIVGEHKEMNKAEVEKTVLDHLRGTLNVDLQLGYRERDLVNNRPKGILATYEKMMDLSEKHTVLGKIVTNPFVMGMAGTVASQGSIRALKWAGVGAAAFAGATGLWVPLGIGAAVGGAYRAFKRSKDVKYDLAQELRHETLGGKGSEILDKKGGLRYEGAVMTFADALSQLNSMKGKANLSPQEAQQLAAIYARLQLEKDLIKSTDKKFTKADLFSLSEEEGKRFGTTVVAKAELWDRIKDLEKLGTTQHKLQGLIDAEKGGILDIIRNIDRKQESFRRWEMAKSGMSGAVLGVAGGVIGQQAGYEFGRLFGSNYLNTHGTLLEKSLNLKHGVFGNAGGDRLTMPHIVHGAGVTHNRTVLEWMHDLKGHVTGGDVQKIHTRDWYDNPQPSEIEGAAHTHNQNELRFYINKDTHTGDLHFKVPVKEGESWLNHGSLDDPKDFRVAQLHKAFADGRMKMIFVPDGANPNQGIVLDVDPVTRDVIIPHDSNLKDLFDPTTGRPKGTGYFGLAEQTGVRGDGSKNYTWVSSDRNNGGEIDFGKVTEGGGGKIEPGKIVRGDIEDYDQAYPLVSPQRKVFLRPEERAKIEAEKKKKEEEKARKKAEKDRKKQAAQAVSLGSEHGHSETPIERSNSEKEIKEQHPELFNETEVSKYVGTYQHPLRRRFPVPEVNMGVISEWWKAEKKALVKAKAEAERIQKEEAAKHAATVKKDKGHGHAGHEAHPPALVQAPVEIRAVHEEGPSIEQYLAEAKKLKQANEIIEGHFDSIADLDRRRRNLQAKTVSLENAEDDIDVIDHEFKQLTGEDWHDEFKPAEFRKKKEEEADPAARRKKQKQKVENPTAEQEPDSNPDTTSDDDDDGVEPEARGNGRARSSEVGVNLQSKIEGFQNKYKGVTLAIDNSIKENNLKAKSIETLSKVMEEVKKTLGDKFKLGKVKVVLIKAGKPKFEKGVWHLPTDVKPIQIQKAIENSTRDNQKT